MKPVWLLFLCTCQGLLAQTDTLLLHSSILDRNITVLRYANPHSDSLSNIIYFTDGQKLIEAGMLDKIRHLTSLEKIHPGVYIWVSSRNPTDPQRDDRNEYFFCNPSYLEFFEKELIPSLESDLPYRYTPKHRSLVGVSFGGLNAAWFSANSTAFGRYAMLSPITYPCPSILEAISFSSNEALRIFLSTGTPDAESYLAPLSALYQSKGYQVETLQTDGAHNYDNWIGHIQTVINFLQRP